MSDSDETVCDNTEEDDCIPDSDTQDSPSIISNVVLQPDFVRNKNKDRHDDDASQGETTPLSPEYPPPSPKIKRTDGPIPSSTFGITMAATSIPRECSASGNQAKRALDSQTFGGAGFAVQKPQETGDSGHVGPSPAGNEILTGIRKQEEEAEDLIIRLEKQKSNGSDPKKSPDFLKAKSLLAMIRKQLTEFSQQQQKQRSELLTGEAPQTETELSRTAWSMEGKQKLQQLAHKQRELLGLCKKRKELVGRLQSVKHVGEASQGYVLPPVEKHLTSIGRETSGGKDLAASSKDHISSHSLGAPDSRFVQALRDRAGMGSNASTGSQVYSLPIQASLLPGQTSQIGASGCAVSLPGSANMQPANMKFILKDGQLYQIGGQQVCFVPNTALTTTAFTVGPSATQVMTTAKAPVAAISTTLSTIGPLATQGMITKPAGKATTATKAISKIREVSVLSRSAPVAVPAETTSTPSARRVQGTQESITKTVGKARTSTKAINKTKKAPVMSARSAPVVVAAVTSTQSTRRLQVTQESITKTAGKATTANISSKPPPVMMTRAATVVATSTPVVTTWPSQLLNTTSMHGCSTSLSLPPSKSPLMTCHQHLSALLRSCHVMPVSDEELCPSNGFLPIDFWTTKDEVKLPASMMEELDF